MLSELYIVEDNREIVPRIHDASLGPLTISNSFLVEDSKRGEIGRKLTAGAMPMKLSWGGVGGDDSPKYTSTPRRGTTTGVPSLFDEDTTTKEQANKAKTSNSVLLILYTLGMLASSVINSICFKRMTSAMPNYASFLNQASSVVYIPIFGCLCLYLYHIFGADGLGGEAVIAFPMYKFTVMGVLDAFGAVMMVLGGIYTTGSSQAVLSQLVIPVTLVTCYAFLGKRYDSYQYVGSMVIMLGVLISKIRSFIDPGTGDGGDLLTYNIIFMLSSLPSAFSAVFKEVAFRDVEMNVNYMQFWVALWQFTIGFFLVPLQSLLILGPQTVPLARIGETFENGYFCLVFGRNSIVLDCGGPGQMPCDNCGGAWVAVASYCLVNIAYNVFSLLVVKYGGATISFLVSTLRLPITSICFASPWLMGSHTDKVTRYDAAGLLVLFVGLCSYRYGSMRKNAQVPKGMQEIHMYTTTLDANPIIMIVPKFKMKSAMQLRHQLYDRLAIGNPMFNPDHLALQSAYVPPKIPGYVSVLLPDGMLKRYEAPLVAPPLTYTLPVHPLQPVVRGDENKNLQEDYIVSMSSCRASWVSSVSGEGRRRQRWMAYMEEKQKGVEPTDSNDCVEDGTGRSYNHRGTYP